MKDIYSPLEIDEEWDNYAPAADGSSSTALMEHPAETLTTTNIPVSSSDFQTPAAEAFAMPASNVMPGNGFHDTGTQEPSKPDTFDIADTSSSNSSDTSGSVSITPGGLTPKTPSTDTPQEIKPVPINVMGGETADSGVKLPEVIDQSKGGTSSPDVPVITPYSAPVVPGEDPKDETGEQTDEGDSDDDIDIGKVSPDTGEKSTDTMVASDDSGESNGNNSENTESSSGDDTENTEADTSSSDATGKSSETKADKTKVENKDTALASGDAIIEAAKNDVLKVNDSVKEERGKIQASIEAMKKDEKKRTDDFKEDMAAFEAGIKAANEKLADYDKFIAQLESFK